MGNNVFANGREVSCKAADGKSICAFPDVCFTPPENPTTPPGVPIPYPNTGMAKDTTSGSKKVKVSGKEVMLKNKSYFKKSMGDEAGCAAKKGVVTSTNRGKVYFNSWSMDVKFEGENVVRHLDLTTHNHASMPGNTPIWPYMDSMAWSLDHPCIEDAKNELEACKECKPYGPEDPCPPHNPPMPPEPDDELANLRKTRNKDLTKAQKARKKNLTKAFKASPKYQQWKKDRVAYYENLNKKTEENDCLKARRCMLVPYKPEGDQPGCCEGQTGHHLIEASAFIKPGTRGKGNIPRPGCEKYNVDKAPCVCAEGPDNTTASHGLMHTYHKVRAKKKGQGGKWEMKEAAETGAASLNMVFKDSCNQKCIEAQIKTYHKEADINPEQEIVASPSGKADNEAAEAAWKEYDKVKIDGNSIAGPISTR